MNCLVSYLRVSTDSQGVPAFCDENLARVSPLAHAHVIPNGSYFQSPRQRAAPAPEPAMA